MVVSNEFQLLVSKISKLSGINLDKYRESYIKRRIDFRMKVIGVESYNRYCKILDTNKKELDNLINTITINVTEFMRDKTPFEFFLKNILPKIKDRKLRTNSRLVRIWSAGCSYGEEAYSIAICLYEFFDKKWITSVYATDIDEQCLETAKIGLYEPNQLKNLDDRLKQKYFDKVDGRYKIKNFIKRKIKFKKHDLTTQPPISSFFDVVFCRNVMIYFNEEQKRKVLNDFYNSLSSGGYLIIGKSESLPVEFKDFFKPVDLREKIYLKV